ncbi:DUF2790 domain-containing protein [Pseudomonas sp. H9]|uniref:DUF2790 domain-containing protein n=1 Tax=Pseudomonas sp. H9 TaxID=483968 RepID=UPI002114B50E|nr:DUF2790 domain-containing protein [Pseudomonas sp. H9]
MAAFSALADTSVTPQTYHYGQRLDVQKVLAIQDNSANACGVVTAKMDYLDSKGQPRSVQYQTYATGACHEGG